MEKVGKNYCIFTAVYFPHLGGLEWYTYNLAKKLVERGNRVTVIASSLERLPKEESIGDIPIYRVPCWELLNGRYPIIKPSKELKEAEKFIHDQKFDRFIVNTRFYMHSIWAVKLARKEKVPYFVLEHGTSHLSVDNPILDKIGAVYEHMHTAFLKMLCKDFYGTCEACNDWLAHFGIKSKGTFYNAIDIEQVQEGLALPAIYRKKYQIPEEALVLTFTGRILPEKGIMPLIEAVKRINNSDKKVYLFIAGEGPLDSYVQKNKDDYIIPLGRISHEEVFRLLGESDIFCLPSFSEAFCGAVLEAVACKCYVITTARGGSKELISSDELGTILPDNKENTVYQGIKDVIDHWDSKKEAVEKVYRILIQNFTWDITAEHIENL